MIYSIEGLEADINLKISENTIMEIRSGDRILTFHFYSMSHEVKLLTPAEIDQ